MTTSVRSAEWELTCSSRHRVEEANALPESSGRDIFTHSKRITQSRDYMSCNA